jgi:hypothetical protein
MTDTGDVASSFHTVGKSYSRNLTKSRVRLLGSCGSNLGANTSSLRRRLVDRLISECVEASLEHRALGLRNFVGTTFLYELVKGWHDFPPSSKIFLYTKRLLRLHTVSRRKKGINTPLTQITPYFSIETIVCQDFFIIFEK